MEQWKEYKNTPWGIIPSHWEISTVKNEALVVTDYVANGSFASLADNVKYKTTKDIAVLIRLVDFNNSFKGDFIFIDEHAYEFLGKSKLFGDEIIISNVGANVGTVFKCPYLKYKMSLAPNAIMVKFKGIDNFYYHWFKSRFGQHMLQSIVTGSAQPKFNKTNFRDLHIPVPPIGEQKRIADFLSSLDDKIELNRQINDNLEQQAQALFNHYFVENTELLGEYDEVSLLDIASYTNGLAMQKYRPSEDETSYLPVMKIKELGQGFTDSNSDICTCNIPEIYIINSGDIIFSWSGTLMVKIWCGETAGLNQHLFKVSSESYEKWFYYFWTKYHLRKFINIAKDKAVTMGHIKREDLAKSKVLLPNQATLQNLNKIFSPIMDSIINNEIESKRQVQLRDTLLPRLMSGELKINEINC